MPTLENYWPNSNNLTWLGSSNGHNGISFSPSTQITSLLPTLEKYWPTLSCSSSSLCFGGKGLFWAHEVATFDSNFLELIIIVVYFSLHNLYPFLFFSLLLHVKLMFGCAQWGKILVCLLANFWIRCSFVRTAPMSTNLICGKEYLLFFKEDISFVLHLISIISLAVYF